jgi:hypothetical protein
MGCLTERVAAASARSAENAGSGWSSCRVDDFLLCAELLRDGPVVLTATGTLQSDMTQIAEPMMVSLDPPTVAVTVPLWATGTLESRRVDLVALNTATRNGGGDADLRCRALLRAAVVRWVPAGNTHRLVVLEIIAARRWADPVEWADRMSADATARKRRAETVEPASRDREVAAHRLNPM